MEYLAKSHIHPVMGLFFEHHYFICLDNLEYILLKCGFQIINIEYYKKIDINNSRRLIRALEVCETSGEPYSNFLNQPKEERTFESKIILLHHHTLVMLWKPGY